MCTRSYSNHTHLMYDVWERLTRYSSLHSRRQNLVCQATSSREPRDLVNEFEIGLWHQRHNGLSLASRAWTKAEVVDDDDVVDGGGSEVDVEEEAAELSGGIVDEPFELLESSVESPLACGFNSLVEPPMAAAFDSAALLRTATSSFRSTQWRRLRTMSSYRAFGDAKISPD